MPSMNKWDCEYAGCSRSVVGCGGAIGLRAIGWYFEIGPRVFCPEHRPDGVPCGEGDADIKGDPECCPWCKAENEAYWIQKQIADALQEIKL